MKKLIAIGVGLSLFCAGAVSAIVVKNISRANVSTIRINLSWNDSKTEVDGIDVITTGSTYDDTGRRYNDFKLNTQYAGLSPQLQASVKNLIKFVGREVNNTTISEDVEPIISQGL